MEDNLPRVGDLIHIYDERGAVPQRVVARSGNRFALIYQESDRELRRYSSTFCGFKELGHRDGRWSWDLVRPAPENELAVVVHIVRRREEWPEEVSVMLAESLESARHIAEHRWTRASERGAELNRAIFIYRAAPCITYEEAEIAAWNQLFTETATDPAVEPVDRTTLINGLLLRRADYTESGVELAGRLNAGAQRQPDGYDLEGFAEKLEAALEEI